VDLQYDSAHKILRETAERFLSEKYDFRAFRKTVESTEGYSPEIWATFAEMGWLAMPFSEEDGGLGGGAVEVAILMECFGKNLVVEPYLASIVLGGGLIAALGTPAQKAELIGALAEGKLKLAFAHDNRAPTKATLRGGDYVIAGAKAAVLSAPMADKLLVSAMLTNGTTGVFVVPADAKGLVLRPYRSVDGNRLADIELTDVTVPASALLGSNGDATPAIAAVIDRTIAAMSSDAVGAMSAMVAQTVEYTKTRVQFGQPLSKFQVLAHRMVDMRVAEEESRASCLLATLSLDGPAERRVRAVSGAKAKIGRSSRFVAQQAIQTHGAIGTTEELPLGAFAKRCLAYEIMFGSTREHLRRYGKVIADPALAGAGLLLEPASA
jgi:alkylation response protein AidB-like acyl-CoA dehydrogenase